MKVNQTEAMQQPDLTVSLLSAEDSLAPLISAAIAPELSSQRSGSLHAAVRMQICADPKLMQLQPASRQHISALRAFSHLQGHQVQTAAWLDKQMQQTDSSKLALTEPDLMLVRLLPVRHLLVAGEPRMKDISICDTCNLCFCSSIIACKA